MPKSLFGLHQGEASQVGVSKRTSRKIQVTIFLIYNLSVMPEKIAFSKARLWAKSPATPENAQQIV